MTATRASKRIKLAKPAKAVDLDRSLDSLEGQDWGEPDYDSYVVTTVHALRRKPLRSLTHEELRLSLSQQVGVPYILDLAFDRLRLDPLITGDFLLGDVLLQLLRSPPAI